MRLPPDVCLESDPIPFTVEIIPLCGCCNARGASVVSNCRYGIDCVNGVDPLALSSCSFRKSSADSQFSDSRAGFLMYASSPLSYDDFRGGGVRVALLEVLFIESCEPCDLPVFGDEEESGLLLCIGVE